MEVTSLSENTTETTGSRSKIDHPSEPGGVPEVPKATAFAIQKRLVDAADAITRKLIDEALGGDKIALRLCFERLAPLKHYAVVFELPPIGNSADALSASSSVLAACSKGTLSAKDAAGIIDLIARHVQILEMTKIEGRLAALEKERSRENKSTSRAIESA